LRDFLNPAVALHLPDGMCSCFNILALPAFATLGPTFGFLQLSLFPPFVFANLDGVVHLRRPVVRAVTGCGETDDWGPEVPIALFSEDGGTPELESSSGQGNP
jgi:hypothetical protein